MMFKFLRFAFASSLLVFTLSLLTFAQTSPSKTFKDVKIKNFGQMDEHFFRGAQPKQNDYQALADLGVKTVVDLREDPEAYERSATEAAGMKYVNLPMSDKKYPTQENVDAMLKLINDPATGTFFVHCAGGRHRTGVFGALYRFTKYGWGFDQVYQEMKNYDFYTSWGHGDMKTFVEDYAAKMKPSAAAAAVK
jgi:protein tyrosine/serine phosphatase